MKRYVAGLAALAACVVATARVAYAADPPLPACSAKTPLTATVEYHFSGPVLGAVAAPCSVAMRDPATNADDPSSTVTLSFTNDGLNVAFDFTQSLLRTNRGVFRNDHIAITIVRTNARGAMPFEVMADANGDCKSLSHAVRFLTAHDQCTADVSEKGSAGSFEWSGSVSIGYAALDSVLDGDRTFAVVLQRTILIPDTQAPGAMRPTFRVSKPHPAAFITLDRNTTNMGVDRYVAAGADIGQPVGVPPHRLVTNAVAGLDRSNLVTATFADDAGQVLSIRDTAAKSIADNAQSKSFGCRSCGAFLSSFTQPFDLALTSTGALGVDLSTLGVDTAPFSLDAVSFPIDAGYKFIHSGDAILGAAAFSGTTSSSGVAHDGVVQYQNAFWFKDNSKLQLGVYHAVANRSQPAAASTDLYPPLDSIAGHTTNTQFSAAFSHSKALALKGIPAATTSAATTLSALLRYGTQYHGSAQTVDAAISTLRDPAIFNLRSKYEDKTHVEFAAGYRSVGSAYGPLDANFDLHTGLHGFYGLVELTNPVCKGDCHLRTKQLDAKVSAYRFSDGVQARDVSLSGSVTYPFLDTLSLAASYATGALTVSQAGRANNILVTDAQGGGMFLPNGQYSAALTYTANTGPTPFFDFSAGYTLAHAQACDVTILTAAPCFPYRGPSVTGSIYWRPFRSFSDFFLSGSIQNSTNQPFPTGESAAALQSSPDTSVTTASHIVRTAAVGAHLFKFNPGGCSTLLLTTTNRGGNIDHFAKSPPQPGYTNTASLELIPAKGWPTVLAAYSRVGNLDTTTPPQTLFVVRVQYGITPKAFAAASSRSCSGS